MGVDTRDRRASVLGLGLAALLVLPAPGAIDQPDRQQLGYCYRGISVLVSDIRFMRVAFAGRMPSATFALRGASVTSAGRIVSLTADGRSAEMSVTGRSPDPTFTFIGHP